MLERLLKALDSHGLKKHGRVSKIANDTGYGISTVSGILSGKEPVNARFLKAVCGVYHFNEDYIQTGNGQMFLTRTEEFNNTRRSIDSILGAPRRIPVISMAQAGDNGFWEDAYEIGQGMEQIECPAQITDPKAIAFRIEGASMEPRYFPGENVVIDTTKEVMNNDDVVVKLRDGRVMVKIYKKVNGNILLESYNRSHDTIITTSEDLVRCYKVVCRI
jgi:phage repressor protein C with HTH and peptisase S24 domain